MTTKTKTRPDAVADQQRTIQRTQDRKDAAKPASAASSEGKGAVQAGARAHPERSRCCSHAKAPTWRSLT